MKSLTTKEAGWEGTIGVKMDAVNLQGLWTNFPQEPTSAGHGARLGAPRYFIYALKEEVDRQRLAEPEELLSRKNRRRLDKLIEDAETREADDLAALLSEL